MSWWPKNWYKKGREKTEEVIQKRIVLLPPYYFSVEAQDFRKEIEELKRQLANSRECEKQANEFARETLKKHTVNGESMRKLSYVREMVRKLTEVLDQ